MIARERAAAMQPGRRRVVAAIAACGAALLHRPARADDPRSVSPYAATPKSVVDAMLSMAAVGPGDFVIDLGSGDGRMVIAAAGRGAKALGVDIDAGLVRLASQYAEREGVAARATFREQDIFETDLSPASVITVYLLPAIMNRIAAKLRKELKPGTRVVTHDFPLPGWRSERVMAMDVPEKRDYQYNPATTLYLYRAG